MHMRLSPPLTTLANSRILDKRLGLFYNAQREDEMKTFLRDLLLIMLLLAAFGFLNIYVGVYSLNAIDAINLRYEAEHRVGEVDRIIRVRALIDQEYEDAIEKQKDCGIIWEQGSFSFIRSWRAEEFIERILKRASRSFEYQFGIQFVLEDVATWNPRGQNSLSLILELQRLPLEDCDLLIGFTGSARDMTARSTLPSAGTLGNYVLMPLYPPKEIASVGYLLHFNHLLSYVLVHEIGHTFGALHPEEIHPFPIFPNIESLSDIGKLKHWLGEIRTYCRKTFSVMNLITGYFTSHFDSHNKEIIFANKYLPSK